MPYKKLSIPEPCQQKWNKMAPNGEGRHCQSCNTTIVDFSDLSDEELIQVLQSGKYHCGRFHEDQMGIMYYIEGKRRERKKYWNSVAAAIVAGILQISSGFGQTETQPKQKLFSRNLAIEKYFEVETNTDTQQKEKEKDKITFVFKNKRYDSPMSGVTIRIKELSFTGTSNGKGEISIDLLPSIKQDQIITVEIEANTYKTTRGKRGYHGKTLFLELCKLINDEKLIYIKTLKGHHRHGGRYLVGKYYN